MVAKPSLHWTFQVGVRSYGTTLSIAHTLLEPVISAAAPNPDLALDRLAQAIRLHLEHLHPKIVWQLMQRTPATTMRLPLPVHRLASLGEEADETDFLDVWDDDEETSDDGDHDVQDDDHAPAQSSHALANVDLVITPLASGMVEIHAPMLDAHAWARLEDAPPDCVLDEDSPALQALLRQYATRQALVESLRPAPDSFELVHVEVAFTPLDLGSLPTEMLWRDVFSPEELGISRGTTAAVAATPTLEAVAHLWAAPPGSEPLADEAHTPPKPQSLQVPSERLEPSIGRQTPLGELKAILQASQPVAVVLVGPARVGKTAIVRHLAHDIAKGDGGGRRFFFADPPRLTSTEPMSPGWQQQCQQIAQELEASGDILYLGRLVEALDAGKHMGSDYSLAQFLKPLLSDKRLRVVAEASTEEWTALERRDLGFARAFNVLRIEELGREAGLEVVRKACARLSERDGLTIAAEALDRAWALQQRFATQGSPVGRTIDFVARTLDRAAQQRTPLVDVARMVHSFCQDTGMPEVMFLDDRTLELETVRARLSSRVIGQEQAIERVAQIVGVTKAGLGAEDRPLGSFLFIGQTGVGKTELARALAEFLFGSEDRLVRLDMSEYAFGDAPARLLGDGSEEGDLTGPVRRQPFCVVLLDEIEKANPGVFDLLLQVLGEARLTDAAGRTTRFQNTIVIMTSNLGVENLRPSMGFGDAASKADSLAAHFRREAERFFRPEFLARIDQLIAFSPLERDALMRIARRELSQLTRRDGVLFGDVELNFGPEVHDYIARHQADSRYGARPIKRAIAREIVTPLARKLAERTREQALEGVRIRVEVEGADGAQKLGWTMESAVARPVKPARQTARAERTRAQALAPHQAPLSPAWSTRRQLLDQLERIAAMRRRVQNCMQSERFSALDWHVEEYDHIVQDPGFWQRPDAAARAQTAEEARRILEPARQLWGEFAALEDLATEAYHSRNFALVKDMDERLRELDGRIGELFLALLRTAYTEPDEVVLFILARPAQEAWRGQLLQWYGELARQRGWKTELLRPLGPQIEDDRAPWRSWWQPTRSSAGLWLALHVQGPASRALLQGEDGLHRLVAPEGTSIVKVIVPREEETVLPPAQLDLTRPNAEEVRSWNLRTREVRTVGMETVPFAATDPWKGVVEIMERMAWMAAETPMDYVLLFEQ